MTEILAFAFGARNDELLDRMQTIVEMSAGGREIGPDPWTGSTTDTSARIPEELKSKRIKSNESRKNKNIKTLACNHFNGVDKAGSIFGTYYPTPPPHRNIRIIFKKQTIFV